MNAEQISNVFAECFYLRYRTRLEGGAAEPLYRPASGPHEENRIFFREDFASSALHEAAHWCIAGNHRRLQEDFGYWYEPARSLDLQQKFETMELRPQAIEWIFSIAADVPFRVSCDNFDEDSVDRDRFRGKVLQAVQDILVCGLPPRARDFARALSAYTRLADPFDVSNYKELPY